MLYSAARRAALYFFHHRIMQKLPHVFLVTSFVLAALFSIGWSFSHSEEHVRIAYAKPLFVIAGEVTPTPTAQAWLLFDLETGEVFAEKDTDRVLPIASVSKLMTALVAYTAFDLDATMTVTKEHIATEGRAGRLKEGDVLSVRELLFPLLLESSNDAAEVLVRTGCDTRSACIDTLNARAHTLNLTRTHFEDPSGLSPQNVSSASDLALLLRHLYAHERHLLDITTLAHYIGETHTWLNNDPVVQEEGYLGGKHGFTPEAGRTFAGIFMQTLADGKERPIGIVLLASDTIPKDVASLRAFVRESVSYTNQN